MRGKIAKAQSGNVIGCRPPYGYQQVRDKNGKVVTLPIPEETGRIVRLIFHCNVYGGENGKPLSADAIAKRLYAVGVPTPSRQMCGQKSRNCLPTWNGFGRI